MRKVTTAACAFALALAWAAAPAFADHTAEHKAEKAKDKIENKAEKAKDKIDDKAEKAKDKVEGKSDTMGDKVERAWDKTKAKAREAKDTVKDKMGAGDKRNGRMDADVRNAQMALKDKGHDPGPVDGIMGPRTSAAVRDFQQKEKLTVTGNLDTETRARLGGSAPAASPATDQSSPKKQTK